MAKPIPFSFVLDELADLNPRTNPMFGCTAIYIGPKIIGVLRERETSVVDNGMWLCTSVEHHASLRALFPELHSIALFGKGRETGWQVLGADSENFEESVLEVCRLVRLGDPRIGHLPGAKKARRAEAAKVARRSAAATTAKSVSKATAPKSRVRKASKITPPRAKNKRKPVSKRKRLRK